MVTYRRLNAAIDAARLAGGRWAIALEVSTVTSALLLATGITGAALWPDVEQVRRALTGMDATGGF